MGQAKDGSSNSDWADFLSSAGQGSGGGKYKMRGCVGLQDAI